MIESDLIVLFSIVFHIICCPYTKVEESFNIQAMHDFLQLFSNLPYSLTYTWMKGLQFFDHFQFPGVVPRTFIGALIISIISYPFHWILTSIIANYEMYYSLLLCRICTGIISWFAFIIFRQGISYQFGQRAATCTTVLLAFQFHYCFYLSRTLPNTYASMLAMVAYGYWLQDRPYVTISLLTLSTVIFRCDMLILLAPLTLQLLIQKKIGFINTILVGLGVGIISLSSTVLFDSLMWNRWLWPEGIVLFFNTVENKSSQWGIMPWHWYFSNALPKSLHLTVPWMICGLLGWNYPVETYYNVIHRKDTHLASPQKKEQGRVITRLSIQNPSDIPTEEDPREKYFNQLITNGKKFFELISSLLFGSGNMKNVFHWKAYLYINPAIIFVVLYSFLPHKELRFTFPVLPLFTMMGGIGLDSILPKTASQLIYPLNLFGNSTIIHKKSTDQSGYEASLSTPPKIFDHSANNPKSMIFSALDSVRVEKKHRQNKTTFNKKTISFDTLPRLEEVETLPMYFRMFDWLLCLVVIISLLLMVAIASVILNVSSHNYPGGVALDRLVHQHLPLHIYEMTQSAQGSGLDYPYLEPILVHFDAASAMTGITRFNQKRFPSSIPSNISIEGTFQFLNKPPTSSVKILLPKVTSSNHAADCSNQSSSLDLVYYSKDEHETNYLQYDWLITEDPKLHVRNGQFRIVEEIKGFDRLEFTKFGGLRVHLKPKLFIIARNH